MRLRLLRLSNESLGYWVQNLSHLPWHAAATTRWEPSLHLAAMYPCCEHSAVYQAYPITTRGVWIFCFWNGLELENLQPKSPILNAVLRCHLCYLCSTSLQAADMALEATQKLR